MRGSCTSQTTFEEASVARAEQRAVRLASIREGRSRFGRAVKEARRPRFPLRPGAPPYVAFFWKNLLSTPDYMRPRTAIVLAALVVAGSTCVARHPDLGDLRLMIELFTPMFAAYVLLFAPLAARQDLRGDLVNVDMLKTYPLRGWQIVLGEILTPVTIVSTAFWLFLLAWALTFSDPDLPA